MEEIEVEEKDVTIEIVIDKIRSMASIVDRVETMNLLVWVEEATSEETKDSIKDTTMTRIEEEELTQETEVMKMIKAMVEIMKVTEVEVVEIEIEEVKEQEHISMAAGKGENTPEGLAGRL